VPDVFLGWFLLWLLLIFLLVRVTIDIFGSRIRVPGSEVGWLPSFVIVLGASVSLPAKRDTGTAAELVCLRDGGLLVLPGCEGGPLSADDRTCPRGGARGH
jgi:hypothetical protein